MTQMNEREIMSLLRENAALSILEAEVIVALKLLDVQDMPRLQVQMKRIVESLAAIDAVRRNYAQ
jgi:hypothetical protein